MASTNFLVDAKMGMARPEFRDGVRVNRTGRRTFTEEYKQGVLRECKRPGASVSAIALSHSLNANVVRKWLRQSAVKALNTKSAKPTILLPVTVTPTSLNGVKDAVPMPQALPARDGRIDIELPGARVCLQGSIDAETLRCVLTLLKQA